MFVSRIGRRKKKEIYLTRERIELPTFRVLGGRDNQIHHRAIWMEMSDKFLPLKHWMAAHRQWHPSIRLETSAMIGVSAVQRINYESSFECSTGSVLHKLCQPHCGGCFERTVPAPCGQPESEACCVIPYRSACWVPIILLRISSLGPVAEWLRR